MKPEDIVLDEDTKVIGIKGQRRKGKGILETLFGLIIADGGMPVVGNYTLYDEAGRGQKINGVYSGHAHPNFRGIGFYELVSFLRKPRQEPPVTILVDELPGWIDSYVSTSKSSRFATHFLNQSAKLGYNFIYTAQRTKRVDINFREGTDVCFMADKDVENQKFIYHVLDANDTEEDTPTGQKLELPFETAKAFWNRYDTYEAVPPLGMDEYLLEMMKYDPGRMLLEVQRQAAILTQKQELRRGCKLQDVKYALLCEKLPPTFAAYVYSALQRPIEYTPVPILPAQTPTEAVEGHQEEAKLGGKEGWLRLRNLRAQRTD